MSDQQKRWNEKYSARGTRQLNPERFLVDRVHVLRLGTVLDVACGDGRHSVYLAKNGFGVTGVDFSEQALLRLKSFARQEELHVDTCQRDLDRPEALAGLGLFDNVIVVHFKPSTHTFQGICNLLQRGGILLMTSFNMKQYEQKGFPAKFCYSEREYVDASPSLQLLEYVQYNDDRGSFDGYVFRKL